MKKAKLRKSREKLALKAANKLYKLEARGIELTSKLWRALEETGNKKSILDRIEASAALRIADEEEYRTDRERRAAVTLYLSESLEFATSKGQLVEAEEKVRELQKAIELNQAKAKLWANRIAILTLSNGLGPKAGQSV